MKISPNFVFLKAHSLELVLLGSQAEHYFKDDPNTCLIKLRQFGELLAQLVADRDGLDELPGEGQLNLLRRLETRGAVDGEVLKLFHELRKTGNHATHSLTGEHPIALSHLKYARLSGIWFHRSYEQEPNFMPGPFIPPENPTQETTEFNAELERLRAEVEAQHTTAKQAKTVAPEENELGQPETRLNNKGQPSENNFSSPTSTTNYLDTNKDQNKQQAKETSCSQQTQSAFDVLINIFLYWYEERERFQKKIKLNDEETLTVTIPAGIQEGQKLRIKGKGKINPITQKRGDLCLTIRDKSEHIPVPQKQNEESKVFKDDSESPGLVVEYSWGFIKFYSAFWFIFFLLIHVIPDNGDYETLLVILALLGIPLNVLFFTNLSLSPNEIIINKNGVKLKEPAETFLQWQEITRIDIWGHPRFLLFMTFNACLNGKEIKKRILLKRFGVPCFDCSTRTLINSINRYSKKRLIMDFTYLFAEDNET